VLTEPFLDITGRVLSAGAGSEQGLLGIAFPPGFKTNSHFYVDYTRRPDGATVVSRFLLTADPNVADTNSEQIIKVVPQPYPNQNGGQLAFGPDGYLYIGMGDGGSTGFTGDPLNNAQNTNTELGKLLRIDVESGAVPYGVPTNNPFVGMPGYAPEIWALGLRNPWRFSFDRSTGDLYIGDVGRTLFEEIDFQPAGSIGGQNYGWRIMEGPTNYNVPAGFTNFSALTPPVAWYEPLQSTSASVIGGYVYRGPDEPRMDGMYFYADFIAGWVWGLKRTGTNWENQVLLSPFFAPRFFISTFGEDEEGRLFFADHSAGRIYQLHDTHQVWAPTFSPTGGLINSNMVLVSCLTTGAVIHVTTNGLDPVESDPIIPSGGLLQVSAEQTNKVRAFRPGLAPSAVSSAVFAPRVGTPTFAPLPGPITNGTFVGISTVTPGATIYYTTNGAAPTTNSLVYSDPLTIGGPLTVRAFAVAEGYSDSSVATATYSAARTATPVFTPGGPAVAHGSLVSISCPTAGSAIYYTLDGSTPTTNSAVYSSPVAVTNNVTVIAIAVAPGYLNSSVRRVSYTLIKVATPQFSSPAGSVTNGSVISISCATSNAIVYYTLDGSDPDTNSTIYSAGFSFTNTVTLKARAFAPLFNPSDIAVASYNFLSLENYVVTTFAGGLLQGLSNGPARLARFATPYSICLGPEGSFYVADSGQNAIRQILSSGEVTTLAGTGIAGYQDGPATNAQFSFPVGISVDPVGNVYVSDWGCDYVRKITNNVVTTLAQLQDPGCFTGPTMWQMETDPVGNIYVGRYGRVHRVSPSGSVSVIADLEYWLWGVSPSLDAFTNVYAGVEYRIVKIAPDGSNELFAGDMDVTGRGDGYRLKALFNGLRDIFVDAATNILVSDTVQIRKIRPDGWVSTLAGTGVAGYRNGRGSVAQFGDAAGLCVDTNGNIYVADGGNNCIRKVSPDTAAIGIADDWQRAHFGQVGIDPNADPDRDGMSNYQEFWASTDPLDPASVLVIQPTSLVSNGRIQIRWQTVAGKTYSVQYSTDRLSWSTFGDPFVGDDSIASVLDPSLISQRMQRYYRVVLSGF